MRGTHLGQPSFRIRSRIIPAHAGNSICSCASLFWMPDHPRACGELRMVGSTDEVATGSSPRMRGTLVVVDRDVSSYRIIPAHAGNSYDVGRSVGLLTDHPRACGELFQCFGVSELISGSSPRMRGTLTTNPYPRYACRIIPAHAGNSGSNVHNNWMNSDHPRACGELISTPTAVRPISGSSPRMRGTPEQPEEPPKCTRIIPAHAGNSEGSAGRTKTPTDHPRACGELSIAKRRTSGFDGSSPRMRGTLRET